MLLQSGVLLLLKHIYYELDYFNYSRPFRSRLHYLLKIIEQFYQPEMECGILYLHLTQLYAIK